nr:protein kinase-like domain, phloem protein 2-like protein [Tanacetum cinerariifolium]
MDPYRHHHNRNEPPYPPPPHHTYPPPPPHHAYPPPPPVIHHVSHEPSHHHVPHVPPVIINHHHTDHYEKKYTDDKPTVRVYCKAKTDYALTIRDGQVVLAPSNPSDPHQHWVKDLKFSTRVKDEQGFPSFALVNKATGQAIKHSVGATYPVQLTEYNPDKLDESVLWTESKDLGDGYRATVIKGGPWSLTDIASCEIPMSRRLGGELIEIDARRLNKERDDEIEQQFWMEISMLSTSKHKNLVSLVGFCDENSEKITITKDETRGSLSKYLSDPMLLTWVRRLEISIGLVHALSYIHYDEPHDFNIIYWKINSGTVLLNDDWEPKLSSFERSMKIKASKRHHSFNNGGCEYTRGGVLSIYLSDPLLLTWVRKLEIRVGLGHALSYIHHDEKREFSIIHRNIKSATVVLHDNWEPKLCDLECSMKIKASQRRHSFHTNKIEYTYGYGDPTYIETKMCEPQVRYIYSFGILTFDLLCGREPIIVDDQDNKYLVSVALFHHREKILNDIVDPNLWKQMNLQSFYILVETTHDCLNKERSQRPSIDEYVPRLEKALELQLERKNVLNEHSIVTTDTTSTHRKLVNTKMNEGASIADHVNEFNSILSRLMSVDIKFDDEVQALLLLFSLPESWSGTVTAVSGSTGSTKLKDKEVNMAARDYDDALVCCVEIMIDDRIMHSGASFRATYCKEELERFKLRSDKVRLADDKTLDIAGVGDVVLKTSFGFEDQQWKVTKDSLVVARGNKRESLYMVEVPSDGSNASIDGRGNAALWHQRLGHMSERGMKILDSKDRIPDLQKAVVGFCEPCVLGKQKKVSFVKYGNTRKLQRLELVHTNVYGPTSVASIGGSRYYVTFIDDSNRKIKMLKIVPETPQQNGVAERINQTLNGRAKRFRIPEEEGQGKEVSLTHLRVFGCDSYVKVKDVARDKLDAKSVKCTFIGYGSDEMGYRFWDSKSHKVVRSIDVTFNEDSLYGAKAVTYSSNLTKPNQKDQVVLEDSLENLANKSIVTKDGLNEEDSKDRASSKERGSETPQLRRSTRESRAPVRYSPSADYFLLIENGEPESYSEALSSKEFSKWVFKVKEEQDGKKKYKARLVVKGFQQKHRVDYNEIFSLVVKMTTIRDRTKGTLRISQEKYIGKVLEKFNMKDAKVRCQPLGGHFKLSKKQAPKTKASRQRMTKIPYASVVGSVMYAMKIAPKRRTTRLNPGTTPVTTPSTTTTSVTNAQLQAMIDEGVNAALAARDATRNDDDSHTSRTGARRPVQAACECSYSEFLKCKLLDFKGTEGVVGLTRWFEKIESVFSISNCTTSNQVKFTTCTLQDDALTWWNSHVKTTTPEAAHAMTWATLKKKMTDKYCPRGEIKKIEAEMWNLKADNKRKSEDIARNNQNQQPRDKTQARLILQEMVKGNFTQDLGLYVPSAIT